MPRPRELPERARVVIVGGGVGGTSIAYHLAQLGERDVVLVDRAELTSGSTFHSAGLVGQLRGSVSLTRMMMDSVALYRSLGEACGWVECGGLRLACTPEREEELHRQVGWSRTFGLPLELLSADEAAALFPLMSTDGVRAASYLPTDGYLDPSQLTYALAEGAREGGCRIYTHTRVTAIDVEAGRVRGVQTEWGPIEAEVVVNAGGMFAAEIGRMAGVRVPVVPFAHEYLVTQPFRDRDDGHLPTLRDPDLLVYYREEGGGLVMGGYERHSAPWSLRPDGLDAIAPDFNGILLEEDWDRFEEIAVNSRKRVPAMEDVKVTRLINGPEAFTPDNEFLLGESEVRGLLRRGRLLRPRARRRRRPGQGDGRVDRRRRAGDGPVGDGRAALRRALPLAELHAQAHARGLRDLLRHQVPRPRAPGRPPAAGLERLRLASRARRGLRREVGLGARELVRVQRAGGRRGAAPARMGRPAVVAGHRRRARRLPRASSALRRVLLRQDRGRGPGRRATTWSGCATTASRAASGRSPTPRCSTPAAASSATSPSRGVEDELFSIVTGTAFGNHDLSWIRRNAPADGSVRVSDVTSRWACFGLWGPRARDVLAPLTPDPLDFGYMTMRELAVGDVPVRALRVTFTGELGWELYCPTEFGAALWRALWEAGEPHGLAAGGYRAIDTLRLEKGYRVWAADITPDETPHEAGLGFCVAKDKQFAGRDALEGREPAKRLRCLVLEDPRSVALGNEPVRVDGEIVGRVTTGGYGYTVGRSIAYAYLPPGHDVGTAVEVDIFGRWVAGEVAAEPLFDPRGERVRV